MAIAAPTGVRLVQWSFGVITVEGTLPSGADRVRVYLSDSQAGTPVLQGTYSIGNTFSLTQGTLRYATLRGYNNTTTEEGTPTTAAPLQVLKQIAPSGYTVSTSSWIGASAQYIIATRNSDSATVILKSTDYFNTFTQLKEWASSDVDKPVVNIWMDYGGYIYYCAANYRIRMSKDNGVTWADITQPAWVDGANLSLAPTWCIDSDIDGRMTLAEYGDYSAASANQYPGVYTSTDPERVQAWTRRDWRNLGSPAGQMYRHVHGYHINPYNKNVHLLSIGETKEITVSANAACGVYVSTDRGQTWGSNLLAGIEGSTVFNGAIGFAFLPDGSAVVSSDTRSPDCRVWRFGVGGDWTMGGYGGSINPITLAGLSNTMWNIYSWNVTTRAGSYESYIACAIFNGQYNPLGQPNFLLSYNWQTGASRVIAKMTQGATGIIHQFSNTIGNTLPQSATYTTVTAFGGVAMIPLQSGLTASPDSDSVNLSWMGTTNPVTIKRRRVVD